MSDDLFTAARHRAEASINADGIRTLACDRCGTRFTCSPFGKCWCSDETFRLPVPLPATNRRFGDCLCQRCLPIIAAELDERAPSSASGTVIP